MRVSHVDARVCVHIGPWHVTAVELIGLLAYNPRPGTALHLLLAVSCPHLLDSSTAFALFIAPSVLVGREVD